MISWSQCSWSSHIFAWGRGLIDMVKNQAMADALERFGEWQQWLQDVLIGMGVHALDTLAFILKKAGDWA